MTPATRELIRKTAVGGQCVLILLGVAWAIFERPAPLVNVRWRDGLSTEARRRTEIELYLQNGEPSARRGGTSSRLREQRTSEPSLRIRMWQILITSSVITRRSVRMRAAARCAYGGPDHSRE